MGGELEIGMAIKQINDALQKHTNNALRGQDLTLTQVGLLNTLYHADNFDMTLKEIERAHHVSQPTAHGIVRRLAEKKLVDTCGDAANRRIKHVRLTEEGRKQAAFSKERVSDAEALLTKNLSADEEEQLRILLKKVKDGFQ